MDPRSPIPAELVIEQSKEETILSTMNADTRISMTVAELLSLLNSPANLQNNLDLDVSWATEIMSEGNPYFYPFAHVAEKEQNLSLSTTAEKTNETGSEPPRSEKLKKLKRPKLPKEYRFIFADDFSDIPEETKLEATEEGLFAGTRKVITQAKLYTQPQYDCPVFQDRKNLPVQRTAHFVFSDSGQEVPSDSHFTQTGLKTFSVNARRIVTWEGFLKRPYRLADTKQSLSRNEKKEMLYDEGMHSFVWQGHPVELADTRVTKKFCIQYRPKSEKSETTHKRKAIPVVYSAEYKPNFFVSGKQTEKTLEPPSKRMK